MPSTTTSKVIAKINQMGMVFPTQVYKSWTLRDLWVESIKDPINKLFRSPDRLVVLDNISFEVFNGDRIGIIGVNGVGKSTLCRCLAGFYKPTKGSIQTYGKVRAIFDTSVGIYPELTGRENAYLLAEFIYPELGAKNKEVVEEALVFSELGSFLDVPYRTYSNGMQARLSLSIVSCLPSELLILDEVFDGADQFFREKISNRILEVIEKSGAVIFVSHSEEQVAKVCNRAIWIKDGKIAFDGDPKEGLALYSKNY